MNNTDLLQNIDPALHDTARALLNTPTQRPDALTLAEFELGTLSAEKAATVANYLAQLPADDPELLLLRQFQANLAPAKRSNAPAPQRRNLRTLIARLLPSPTATSPALAVRGTTAAQLHQYVADDVRLTLNVRPSRQHPHRWQITGMVVGLDGAIEQVRLFDAVEATEIGNTPVVNGGNFSADNLPPGNYAILLQTDAVQVEIEAVTIG